MITLIILFGTMLLGFIMCKRKVRVPDVPERLMTYTVWGLVFLFGVSIGGNRDVLTKLYSFGFTALMVAVFCVVGSVFGAWVLWKFRKKI